MDLLQPALPNPLIWPMTMRCRRKRAGMRAVIASFNIRDVRGDPERGFGRGVCSID